MSFIVHHVTHFVTHDVTVDGKIYIHFTNCKMLFLQFKVQYLRHLALTKIGVNS